MRTNVTYLFIFLAFSLFAQKEDYNWLTGHDAGRKKFHINFDQDTFSWTLKNIPGRGHSTSSYYSVSDPHTGLPQFYSGGQNVFSFCDQLMSNGEQINYGAFWEPGRGGYTDNGFIILSIPDSIDKYFMMYKNYEVGADSLGSFVFGDQFRFSIIDMKENGGKGELIKKDVFILRDTLEADNMAACRHGNGRDWWIPIFRSEDTTAYMIFTDSRGIHIQDTFLIKHKTRTGLGQSVFTPDGTKLISFNAANQAIGHYIDIFDFDRCEGKLINHQQLNYIDTTVWSGGAAVSPNSRYLYISNSDRLFQFDLWADDIFASIDTIGEYDGFLSPFPTRFYLMQLAPDGKIYMSSSSSAKVWHVIHEPNKRGNACRFEQHGIHFPHNVGFGLPKFPNYRLGPLDGSPCDTLGINNEPVARFRWEKRDSLNNLNVSFVDLSFHEPATWFWEFDSVGVSNEMTPDFTFPESGVYEVCLTVENVNGSHRTCKNVPVGSGVVATDFVQTASMPVVFPNPTNHSIQLDFNDSEVIDFQLFNLTGQLVFEKLKTNSNSEIVVNHLPKGIYFYQVTTLKTGQTFSGKLVVEK